MAFDPIQGLMDLDAHLARLKTHDPAFDRHVARNELQAATFRLRASASVRLALSHSGAIAIEVRQAG